MKQTKPTEYAYFLGKKRRDTNGNVSIRKSGAVVALVDSNTIYVGWSMCNRSEGDRFNPEMAVSLANGRAKLQHINSVKYSIDSSPTTLSLIKRGVPQSTISTISRVIKDALRDHKDIKWIQIFNTKGKKEEPKLEKVW